VLGIANIILPLTIAVDYFQSGAKYIQYVWVFVAVMWMVTFFIQLSDGQKITCELRLLLFTFICVAKSVSLLVKIHFRALMKKKITDPKTTTYSLPVTTESIDMNNVFILPVGF